MTYLLMIGSFHHASLARYSHPLPSTPPAGRHDLTIQSTPGPDGGATLPELRESRAETICPHCAPLPYIDVCLRHREDLVTPIAPLNFTAEEACRRTKNKN
ncbi:hypothetical protein AG1IA_00055 [Rhizoctonia solani AG-1 IA]|uniref:Uncharacterized protein n=1 Tax=Thanatephorus cucumeris (strain AG1-IA) TaxID=983506 RepID=L8X9Z8_THACA|nr:hypothetical protein AG1IA_00055 [Rhizoctonia solani AG-1 IA]